MRDWFAPTLRFASFVGFYLAGSWLATLLVAGPDQVTLIWPSAGLALAILVLFGRHWWPFIAVSVLLLHIVIAPVPPAFVPFSVVANSAAALLGAWWVRRFYPRAPAALRVRYGFVLLGGGLLLAVTAGTIGTMSASSCSRLLSKLS